MKKIISFIAILFVALSLTSCFIDGDNSKFEITNYPKTTYVKGENFDWSTLKINVNGEIYSYSQALELEGIEFPEIILYTEATSEKEEYQREAGTYAATIKYKSLTVSFQYTVLDSYFANGNGTKENPYQISTASQLEKALKQHAKETYYVLINDIDMANYTMQRDVTNMHLDGQGYKLKNMVTSLIYNVDGVVSFENFDVEFNIGKDSEFAFPAYGFITCMTGDNDKQNTFVTYKNINTYGRITDIGNLQSIYGYIRSYATVVFQNCNNFMYFEASKANYCAVYTAAIGVKACVYALDCKNYGTCIAQGIALFSGCGNAAQSADSMLILDEKTANYGKIIYTDHESNLFIAETSKTSNRNAVMSRLYKYDENIGIVAASAASGMNAYGPTATYDMDGDYKKLAIVKPQAIDNKMVPELALIDKNLNFELKSSSYENVIGKYVITITGNYQLYDAEGGLGANLIGGGRSEGGNGYRYYDVEFDLLEAVKQFLNEFAIVNIRNTNSTICPKDYNSMPSDFVKVVGKDFGKLSLYQSEDGSEMYYAFNVLEYTGSDGYLYSSGNYIVTINMFSENNELIGATQYVVENK